MGGRGKGLKKKARVNVFVLKWMDKSIGDEPNLCGNYVHLARHGLCRIYALLSRIRFCREYALFWVYFVQTFTQTSRILLRFCADICPKYRRLGPLLDIVALLESLGASEATLAKLPSAEAGYHALAFICYKVSVAYLI